MMFGSKEEQRYQNQKNNVKVFKGYSCSWVKTIYQISDRTGLNKSPDGYLVHRTLGSYNHLHFGSQPQAAKNLVNACYVYRREKENRL